MWVHRMAEGAEAGTAKLLLFVATECSHFFRNIAAAVSTYQETGVLPDSLPASAPLADQPKKKKGGRPRKDAVKDKPARAKRKPSGGCPCLQHGNHAHGPCRLHARCASWESWAGSSRQPASFLQQSGGHICCVRCSLQQLREGHDSRAARGERRP